jgi:hypothetical protein
MYKIAILLACLSLMSYVSVAQMCNCEIPYSGESCSGTYRISYWGGEDIFACCYPPAGLADIDKCCVTYSWWDPFNWSSGNIQCTGVSQVTATEGAQFCANKYMGCHYAYHPFSGDGNILHFVDPFNPDNLVLYIIGQNKTVIV